MLRRAARRTRTGRRAPRIRSTRPRTSPASRRRCSSARRSTTSACSCCSTSSSSTRRRRGRARPRRAKSAPDEPKLTGFVFKIQANMDPQHRDRVAFMRVCSGQFDAGMKAFHVRTGKEVKLANALTFMASDREIVESAYPGDVIGIHNHGTISIGDTFTEGEALRFTGIPNFAPELFRRARLRDPLKLKQLQKGLAQLSRGRRDAVLPPADEQRPDPRRGRHAAVRRGRLPPEGRVRRRCQRSSRSASPPRAGSAATTRRSWRSSATRTR